MTPTGRLSRKYAVIIAGLVTVALVLSGLVEIYFSYQEHKNALILVQREKAVAAAARIEAFVRELEGQIGWATHPVMVTGPAAIEQRRLDYFRLLRQVSAVTEIAQVDSAGREQLRVSRLAMDVLGSQADFSQDPKFVEARKGRTYFSPVYFRKESEPYMTIAMPAGSGVAMAEVNLKFIWDVITRIKVGEFGHAYVVDSIGQLIAHPDISLVLKKTDLSGLEQVRAALASGDDARGEDVTIARGLQELQVLTAHAPVAPLGWSVFVEQPLREAFQPIRASIVRAGTVLLVSVVLAVAAGLVLVRRMVRPVHALGEGAARLGTGELSHRIDVRTGDELQALAEQFNRMGDRLQESYAGLERKVDERTRELSQALEQQTATAEILRTISGATTDLHPVFETVLQNAVRLCGADLALLFRCEDDAFTLTESLGARPEFVAAMSSPRRAAPDTGLGQLLAQRRAVQIEDLATGEAYRRRDPIRTLSVEVEGVRTWLGVPMLKDDELIGALVVYRREVRPFDARQIDLLGTFASQAVIAIENVRLFTELQQRTAELARSVDELKALGEVGRALSSTLDMEAVLREIVARAGQLGGFDGCSIFEYDEASEEFALRVTNETPEVAAAVSATPLRKGEGALGRAAETGEPVQIVDIVVAGAYDSPVRDPLVRAGYRSLMAVPLASEGRIIGGLVVSRRTAGAFPAAVVELLRTFATQSSLAIRNARLFREIEEKGQQLEIANRHKSEFLANMSHELRTPLNAIIGFSEVLLERMFGELTDKQDEYLHDIFASGRHLLSLINDILDLSKIEAGRMELELAKFHLPTAVATALTLVKTRADNHGIALEQRVDERLGDFVGDERKLKQILLNLLSNAVKFTPSGGRVGVRAEPVDGAVEISVTDTGIGIASEDQELVFEAFRQATQDHAGRREGTGLGLTLTRKFVELHGGRIWVKSEVGRGSTFTFSLPMRPWPAS